MLEPIVSLATLLAAVLVVMVLVAHLPVLPLIRLVALPVPNKGQIARCYGVAWLKATATIPVDLLAPLVVPIALLFTRWEDEHLPRLFAWWDNDASINGDRRTDDPADGLGGWALKPVSLDRDSAEAVAMCYYAPGRHPRSFYARWVWLGLRNRASALSQIMGTAADGEPVVWSGPGWSITRVGNVWRYFELLPCGPVAIRLHYGYKVPRIRGEQRAPVVAIGFSLRRVGHA